MNPLFSEKLRTMQPYHVGQTEANVILDANENPYNLPVHVKEKILDRFNQADFNRYPDSTSSQLKKALSQYAGVPVEQIAVGAGSDEVIHILMQVFLDPGDKVVIHSPTFSMYQHYALLSNGQVVTMAPSADLSLDPTAYAAFIKKENPKVVFLCSPNNPTGQGFQLNEIEVLIQATAGAFILDEAYVEFSGNTAVQLLEKYSNLVILRTLSKAFGIASIRLGYALASTAIIQAIDTVRSPFNVNALTQIAATAALESVPFFQERIQAIQAERDRLQESLASLKGLTLCPSVANFLLFKTAQSQRLKERFEAAKIRVRVFDSPAMANYIRFSMGTPEENQLVLSILQEVCHE